nr:hypothetical protein [Secundilactobacillus kimchicus]
MPIPKTKIIEKETSKDKPIAKFVTGLLTGRWNPMKNWRKRHWRKPWASAGRGTGSIVET